MNDAVELAIDEADKPVDRVTLNVHGMRVTVPAEDVVHLILDRMRASAASVVRIPAVRIGAAWPEQGGTYAGMVRGDEGQPDYHLILAELALPSGPWKPAMDWAKALVVGRFNDFSLPKRKEQAVLFGNVPESFEKEWYWSCEEHSNTESAWSQNFDDGNQSYGHQDNYFRARAVRRVPI